MHVTAEIKLFGSNKSVKFDALDLHSGLVGKIDGSVTTKKNKTIVLKLGSETTEETFS